MDKEIARAITQAKIAQRRNHILTPDRINGNVIISTRMNWNESMGGFVAKHNTYEYRDSLKKAGFMWLGENKVWFKPINQNKGE